MLGLQCDDENFKSYGDDGKTLAASIDPETIPGSEPFPESALLEQNGENATMTTRARALIDGTEISVNLIQMT